MITYQIYEFNEQLGNIQVMFKDDEEVLACYSVDIPIGDNGLFMSGEELDAYLRGMFPQHIIDRKNQLLNGIPNSNEIASLVIPLPVVIPETDAPENQPLSEGTQTV
jgi:hypothetical protein